MKKERRYELQDRLVDYAVLIIQLSQSLPETKSGFTSAETAKKS